MSWFKPVQAWMVGKMGKRYAKDESGWTARAYDERQSGKYGGKKN